MSRAPRALVWDLPTRVFHWLVVLLVGVSWATAEWDMLSWHKLSGYAILTLVLFRLCWGFAGGTTARFVHFVTGPRAVAAYARRLFDGDAEIGIGHNPMGGWSVLLMLLLLLVQTGTGLFSVDVDGLQSGPLSDRVSFETGRFLAGIHAVNFTLLQIAVALHLAAIVFYQRVKRQDLIRAMITGRKAVTVAPDFRPAPPWRTAILMAAALLLVAALTDGFAL
jgi:cytochrome b